MDYLPKPGSYHLQFSTMKEEEASLLNILNPSGSFGHLKTHSPVPSGQRSETPNLKVKGQLLPVGFVLAQIYSLLLL